MLSTHASTEPRNSSPSPTRRPSYQTQASAMSNSASGTNYQLNGHSGHAPCASALPRPAPMPGFSVGSPSCTPTPAFANRGLAPPPARPQGRPTDLRLVGASRRGLDQRSMLNSFVSPLPILSNCRARRGIRAVGTESAAWAALLAIAVSASVGLSFGTWPAYAHPATARAKQVSLMFSTI